MSTASSSVDIVEHNVWNPMTELLLHVQVGGVFEMLVEEIGWARITISCHLALVYMVTKKELTLTHDAKQAPLPA